MGPTACVWPWTPPPPAARCCAPCGWTAAARVERLEEELALVRAAQKQYAEFTQDSRVVLTARLLSFTSE